jgi:hypothetical protein
VDHVRTGISEEYISYTTRVGKNQLISNNLNSNLVLFGEVQACIYTFILCIHTFAARNTVIRLAAASVAVCFV